MTVKGGRITWVMGLGRYEIVVLGKRNLAKALKGSRNR